jgi:endoglucanase
MRHVFTTLLLIYSCSIAAQPVIYKDISTLITGTWAAAGTGGTATLAEVTTNSPYEGTKHYQFGYSFTDWWAGIGLNMDNWGSSPARNLSGYSHLRLAYRGLSAGQSLVIRLRNGSNYGNEIQIGGSTSAYTVVDLSMLSLTVGTSVSASAVREINISVSSNTQTGNGTFYLDAIELINTNSGAVAASPATQARAAALGNGVNTSNWLEAFWLLPFGTYPEVNRYNRTKVRDLTLAGFSTFRMPVIFERLGATSPPYALDVNHTAFRLVDSMILWSDIYGFKLIIDNHHGYDLTDANYVSQMPRLKAVWTQLADRYGHLDPEQYFFELYNEPNAISNANFRKVADTLTQIVRAREVANGHQTHSIFVGGDGWNSGNGLIGFTPLSDPDIIYTFHNYDPYFFTHQGMSWTSPPNFPPRTFPQAGEVAAINTLFANVKAWSTNYSVPVSLGEYGCSTSADATSRCNWIQTLASAYNAQNFSHFYWDAISPTDAFGFYSGGVISQPTVIPCFSTALGLYTSLSVELEVLTLKCDDLAPLLHWEANVLTEGTYFDIQRSNDGIQWKTIHSTNAQTGLAAYSHQDPAGGRYYRIVTTSSDGEVAYSAVLTAQCEAENPVLLYPNPGRTFSTIQTAPDAAPLAEVQLLDAAGRVIWQQNFDDPQTIVSIPAYQFPQGTYIVSVMQTDGHRWHRPYVILR